ncbi:GPP34 family phosphoprotein [Streptomyces sp. NPDC127044]
MTTARDLALITLGMPTDLPVAQGDLSLALAGAEAVDLLENGALSLDGDRMVPGPRVATGDRLLDQADASLTRREPYETVDDRLWRRGSELAAAYVDDLGGEIGRCSGGAPTGVVTSVSGVFTPTSWGRDGDGRTGTRRGHVAWGALGLRCLGGASQGARQLIDRRLLKTG